MAGLLGFGFNTNAPSYTTTPLDQGTQHLIDTQIGLANQTPGQFAAQSNQGVSEAGNQALQNPSQASQEDARMGYSNGAINGAIRNQYNAKYGQNVQHIQEANNQAAVFQKSAQTQAAVAAAMARQNVQTQSYEKLMKAYNDTETARAQVLSSILGAGGTAVGYGMASRHRGQGGGAIGTMGSQGQMPGGIEGEEPSIGSAMNMEGMQA